MTMNKMMVIGNLGRDPEMRYTPNGQSVTSFTVATNRRYTTADGESREETEWFSISAWGRLAELCNQYLTKGQKVYVEGRLRSRSYETRDGQTRFVNEINANDVRFLSQPSRVEDLPPDAEQAAAEPGAGGPGMEAEELPF
jgi:single-strand DNA-binding protein